jgi:hypothetical protein
VGSTAGHLSTLCARDAPTAQDEAWYWGKAIDLLDQLCDVGAEGRTVGMHAERLEELTSIAETRRSDGETCRDGSVRSFDPQSPLEVLRKRDLL